MTALFGNLRSGRLSGSAFVLWTLGLVVVFLGFVLGIGLTVSLRSVWWIVVPVAAVFGFAVINVFAKRWRSAGLPGWTLTFVWLVASVAAYRFGSPNLAASIVFGAFLIASFLPARQT